MNTTTEIKLIRAVHTIQMRTEMNQTAIDEYAETIKGGTDLPPVGIIRENRTLWLWDGFHRLEAYKKAGATHIPSTITEGTKRDAILAACGANADHGLRRTSKDKRKAVQSLLGDKAWKEWSDREIAKACRVHHQLVATVREETGVKTDARKYTTSTGKTATQPAQKGGGSSTFEENPIINQPLENGSFSEEQPETIHEDPPDQTIPEHHIEERYPDEYDASADHELIASLEMVAMADDKLAEALNQIREQGEELARVKGINAELVEENERLTKAFNDNARIFEKKIKGLQKALDKAEKKIQDMENEYGQTI